MGFSAGVGETIFLPDKSPKRHRRVILTEKNDSGKIVVVNFTDAKNLPGGKTWGPKDCGFLFPKPTTVFLPDAKILDHKTIKRIGTDDPGIVGENCPMDIVIQIVHWAIRSDLTPPDVLEELKRCYPKI